MQLSEGITILPVLNSAVTVSRHIRQLCTEHHYDCIAVDLPEQFSAHLSHCIDQLPLISAAFATGHSDDTVRYIPADPCDACIEAIRQAKQQRTSFRFIGHPSILDPSPCPKMPDTYAITRMGFDEFFSLCLHVYGNPSADTPEYTASRYIAHSLRELEALHRSILALVHVRHFVSTVTHFNNESSYNLSFPEAHTACYKIKNYFINPDHLYFVLGELPYITAKCEEERRDPFLQYTSKTEAIKELFHETKYGRFNETKSTQQLSSQYIQTALTFARNLAITEGNLTPSLFDMLQAAKGVAGNTYAYNLLKNAKYYPFLPYEIDKNFLSLGIDKVQFSEGLPPHPAYNLLNDRQLTWKKINIYPEPEDEEPDEEACSTDSIDMGMWCSHIPEDRRIEHFNSYAREKTKDMVTSRATRTVRFTSSLEEGIDLRETIRNWHTGKIYVKQHPPRSCSVDTVIIVFDATHDERYPHCATWSAEHKHESTLSFFATDPFEHVIGPGISRAYYGGLSLVYPPRPIENPFEITEDFIRGTLTHRLVYGACMFSERTHLSYIAYKKPDYILQKIAQNFGKRLVWIPLSHYGKKTLQRLRTFHVLNGKVVRSWASRFIPE